jgi:hypothetical protein
VRRESVFCPSPHSVVTHVHACLRSLIEAHLHAHPPSLCIVPQLEKQVIEVSVFDANKVTRNSLIGLYEFDLLNVYYNPNHEVRFD